MNLQNVKIGKVELTRKTVEVDSFAEMGDMLQGKYQRGPRLGKGRFGDVVQVTDTTSGERYALKVIRKTKIKSQLAKEMVTLTRSHPKSRSTRP